MGLCNVEMVVRGVGSADEDLLNALQLRLEGLGAEGVAIVFYPEDGEIGLCFDINEEDLLGLSKPEGDRAAA